MVDVNGAEVGESADGDSAEEASAAVQTIGYRIRQLRGMSGKTLQVLADETGLSPSLLSLVERGKTSPSIGTLVSVSRALGVHMSDLVTPDTPASKEAVVHSDAQPVYLISGGGQRRVVADDRVRGLEIAVNTFEVGGASAESSLHHGGYEYGVLLEGELTVTLDDQEMVLKPGDMISYESTRPHRIRNTGRSVAKAVWVNLDRS